VRGREREKERDRKDVCVCVCVCVCVKGQCDEDRRLVNEMVQQSAQDRMRYIQIYRCTDTDTWMQVHGCRCGIQKMIRGYGAAISRLLKIIGLFCRI